jgi:hypothetical protein
MKLPLLLAGAFACLSFAVSAAECEFPFDTMIGEFSAAGAPIIVIEPADLPAIVEKVQAIVGHPLGEVTRGFFVQAGGKVLLGLEVDGCLIEPIFLGFVQPAGQLSGKDKDGRIGA